MLPLHPQHWLPNGNPPASADWKHGPNGQRSYCVPWEGQLPHNVHANGVITWSFVGATNCEFFGACVVSLSYDILWRGVYIERKNINDVKACPCCCCCWLGRWGSGSW